MYHLLSGLLEATIITLRSIFSKNLKKKETENKIKQASKISKVYSLLVPMISKRCNIRDSG